MNATPQDHRQGNISAPEDPDMEGNLQVPKTNADKQNKYLYILTLIAFCGLSACQSLNRDRDPNEGVNLLETKKQIVTNSLDSGQSTQALREVKTLLREYPADPDVINLHGLVQLSLRNTTKAREALETARHMRPDNLTFTLNLSSAYIQGRQYAKATTLLKEAAASEPAKTYRYRERIFHNLGLIAELSNDSIRSERWYAKALEENPTNFMTLLKMARIYETTHRNLLAIDKLETATAVCPKCPEPVESMVRILVKQQKTKAAKAAVESFEKNESLTLDDTRRIVEMKRMIAKSPGPVRS